MSVEITSKYFKTCPASLSNCVITDLSCTNMLAKPAVKATKMYWATHTMIIVAINSALDVGVTIFKPVEEKTLMT